MMTGTCAYCLRQVSVRADGRLARHERGLGRQRRRCAGSGRPPKRERAMR